MAITIDSRRETVSLIGSDKVEGTAVFGADDRKIVGYLGRPQVLAARLRRLDEEHVREPGWFKGFRRSAS